MGRLRKWYKEWFPSLANTCCNEDLNNQDSKPLNQNQAVEARYGAAAKAKEACLCTPVGFNPRFLEVIPNDVIERDYGCGDPTRWVKRGDHVLDLGSGGGKNAFICSQIVGRSGSVIGIDRSEEMLSLAKNAAQIVAKKIGYSNVNFIKGSIESLDEKDTNNVQIVRSSSVNIVLSNCVLNLVNPSARIRLLKNIRRVLSPMGRVAISDIVSNKEVPLRLQKDSDLWSGCISGAWQEERFLEDFQELGFKEVIFADRSDKPWKVLEGIEFRAVTLTAHL